MAQRLPRFMLLSLLALASCLPVGASQLVVEGPKAKENTQKVTSAIKWHTSMNTALAQARAQNKMLLWVHMIGKIDGAT
ncbi:MAG: hypothetical protein K8F91_10510 [Candidatus Obscuribacterales bacterium]|nr:hypothetical protein [Candidatus Obscuribacterales bacterium]